MLVSLGLLATWLIPFPKRKTMIDNNENESYDDETPIDLPTIPPIPEEDSFRSKVVTIADGEIGNSNEIKYSANALGITETEALARGANKLSWCGLFATWVLQQAGADVKWQLGKGICYQLPRTKLPQPGDIAYIDQPYQHHAIVETVGHEMVTTIDGNSDNGRVARKTRPLSAITAFYDIGPLDPNNRIA